MDVIADNDIGRLGHYGVEGAVTVPSTVPRACHDRAKPSQSASLVRRLLLSSRRPLRASEARLN